MKRSNIMKLAYIRKFDKFYWTCIYLHRDLCDIFFKKVKKRNIENIKRLEKILFIMQYESLQEFGVPLLVYKSYYYEGEIYLKFLSDLLRVAPTTYEGDTWYWIRERVEDYQYDKKLKNYIQLTEEELDQKIDHIIKDEELDSKYFRFEKYNNWFYRRKARYVMGKGYYFRYFFGIISFACVFFIFYYYTATFLNKIGVHIGLRPREEYIQVIGVTFPILVMFLTRMLIVSSRHSKFEKQIENGEDIKPKRKSKAVKKRTGNKKKTTPDKSSKSKKREKIQDENEKQIQ